MKTIDAIKQAFNEALAWGMVYGPVIPPHQWDEMRDKQVEQYIARIAAEEAQTVEPVAWLYRGVDEVMQLTFTDQREVDAFRVNDQGWEPATPLFTHPVPATERGEVVVTFSRDGQIQVVTRQDSEGRILSIIAESRVA